MQLLQVPVQICALIETIMDGNSTFWFVAVECETLNRSDSTFCAFPTIKYRLNSRSEHYYFISKVDTINEPALVIPVSLDEDDFKYQLLVKKRKEVLFTSIPFGFLNRDDWGEGTNLGLIDIDSTFRSLKGIKPMLNRENRQLLYEQLRMTLLKNGKKGRVLEDGDVLEEHLDEEER